ncbi:hypothetical protein KI387_043490, partial [Taxus chinensis]
RELIFQGGPWFFGRAGLFMKPWHTMFKAEELPSVAPVWVRLFGLPAEYWNQHVFMEIGNSLGTYMMTADASLKLEQMIYARICVLMDLNQPLPQKISLAVEDETWEQVLDYENIPFRCRNCHEYGHLVRDCPLKIPDTTVEGRKHEELIEPKGKKTTKEDPSAKLEASSHNRFASLQQL